MMESGVRYCVACRWCLAGACCCCSSYIVPHNGLTWDWLLIHIDIVRKVLTVTVVAANFHLASTCNLNTTPSWRALESLLGNAPQQEEEEEKKTKAKKMARKRRRWRGLERKVKKGICELQWGSGQQLLSELVYRAKLTVVGVVYWCIVKWLNAQFYSLPPPPLPLSLSLIQSRHISDHDFFRSRRRNSWLAFVLSIYHLFCYDELVLSVCEKQEKDQPQQNVCLICCHHPLARRRH